MTTLNPKLRAYVVYRYLIQHKLVTGEWIDIDRAEGAENNKDEVEKEFIKRFSGKKGYRLIKRKSIVVEEIILPKDLIFDQS